MVAWEEDGGGTEEAGGFDAHLAHCSHALTGGE